MRIGSFIVIVLSLIATAFSVAVTAVGWERILFYGSSRKSVERGLDF